MRLTVFLLFIAALLSVHAASKAQTVTLSGKDLSLRKVFIEIEKQTGYVVFYNRALLSGLKNVSLKVKAMPLEEVLDSVLKSQQLDFVIQDKTISISRKPVVNAPPANPGVRVVAAAQPVSIHVTDSAGRSLAGASILVKGSTVVSGVTDSDGLFTAQVNEGDMIVVSFIGHQTRTINVTEAVLRNSVLTVIMESAITRLANVEVVVNTGYQKLSKERATGSFSKPDMKVFANRSNTMDVIGRLDGQIPGMIVFSNRATNSTYNNTIKNPATGAPTQKALVRGEGSIQLSTEPLYVVNGIAVQDFSALNIDDIADITVLKDAAAAAIWGAKAANGVIVVTTKSGPKNQKLKISYNGSVSMEGKPDYHYLRKQYVSSRQYIDVAKQLFDPVNFPYSQFNSIYNYQALPPSQQVLYDQDRGLISSSRANAMLDSMAGIDNTRQVEDILFQPAFTTNHTISLSGGGNNYGIFASLGYTNSHAYIPGQQTTAYKINISQTFTPNNRFNFSLDAQLTDNVSKSTGALSTFGDILPYQLLRDASGQNINMPYLSFLTPEVIRQYSAASNIDLGTYVPLDELGYSRNRTDFYAINLVGNATVKLWKGISFQGSYGYAISPTTSTSIRDNRMFDYRKILLNNTMPGNPPTYLIPRDGVFYMTGNNNQRSWTARNQLVYNYSGRAGNDIISLQAGQEANEVKTDQRSSAIYGYNEQLQTYPVLDYATLNKGVPGTVGGYGGNIQAPFDQSQTISRYSSYFALASYTLNHKYSIDGSWRVDHSNLFGSDVSSQNKPAYSMGGKWNMKQEHFMEGVNWLNALALRATYGVAGNSPYVGFATQYDVLFAESIPNYQYPVIGGPAYMLSSPANRHLSWESTKTTNLGVDFGMFNNRLTGSLEYYHKNTTDLLGQVPLNYFTGFGGGTGNIGRLVNNGVNVTLSSTNITRKNFSWQTGLVLGYNQNKLVTYEVQESYTQSPGYLFGGNPILGYSLNPIFVYRYAGLNADGDPQIRLADGKVTSHPGDALAKDLIYKGSTVPKFNGGFTNYFQYKQFGLSINMTYSFGAFMETTEAGSTQFFSGALSTDGNIAKNLKKEFLQRWQKPGDENTTNVPRYLPIEDYNLRDMHYYLNSDVNIASASFVKLSEAVLSYSLDPQSLQWLKISGAVLRLQVSNILLWKANKLGINPEFQSPGTGIRSLPVGQHSITIGANVNF